MVDNYKLYEAWAEEFPYPSYEMVQIIGSKFTDYLHEGRIQREDIVDIADIINKKHPGRESDDEIIVYSVGGMPVEDIAWGGTVYRNALKEGIGVELPWQRFKYKGRKKMKNVMPMQPYLVLDTDDYEVKKEMKSGISHFYEFSKKKSLKEEMKAVPDGSVDLLFGIGEHDVKTCIGGTVLAAKGWEFEDGRSYFGVRFQPGSCILPEELSIRDLVNKDLEIDGNLFGDHLTEKLAGSKNISERVNVFTTEYAKLRGKELADGIQKLENYLRERIYDTDGCICIRQLAEETGYSECYIRRVFQQVHGISPKNFERFVRFQKLLHVINKMPERIRLDALAQQCGYYDEAHMIKDFKQYAGITPQGYERLITGTKISELEL